MKRLTFILVTAIFLCMTFSACSKSKDNDTEAAKIPEIYNRNIDFGMSEEEVITQEAYLTFDTDYSRTEVNTEHTFKCITSNEPVQINNDEANISYIFLDDTLIQIEYNLQVNYSKDKILDTPALQVYNKQVTDLSDIIGLPSETTSDEYSTFNFKSAVWYNSDFVIGVDVIQTTDTFSNNDITDTVNIIMINQTYINQ